jgi:Tfp pilus assembly protein PilF
LLPGLLLLLAGCSAAGKVMPAPEMQARQIVAESGVTRFEDARSGFVLSEKTALAGDLRDDFEQAVAFMHSGDVEPAIELLEMVVDSSPKVTAPYINLAIGYRKVGAVDAAELELKKALQLFPGHPVASNEYGLLLRKSGRFAEAREIYEQALTNFPEYLPLRKNLGVLCDLYLQDQQCALTQYRQYQEIDPQDQQVRLWLSELQLRQGQ